MEDATQRTVAMTTDYTNRIGKTVERLMPAHLDDAEFALRSSAMLIALNRQIARVAASFCATHGVMPDVMTEMVREQFGQNFTEAMSTVLGTGRA